MCLSPEGAGYYSRIKLQSCNISSPSQQWAQHSVGSFWYFESLYAPGKCIGALVGPSISEMVLAECVIRPSIQFKKAGEAVAAGAVGGVPGHAVDVAAVASGVGRQAVDLSARRSWAARSGRAIVALVVRLARENPRRGSTW
jgi:hypothetical protein